MIGTARLLSADSPGHSKKSLSFKPKPPVPFGLVYNRQQVHAAKAPEAGHKYRNTSFYRYTHFQCNFLPVFFFCLGPVSQCSGSISAKGLLCNPKHSVQHRFSNPVSLIKRQRSLTEAVLIYFGSTDDFPKMLYR
jgi:hypothetical protein